MLPDGVHCAEQIHNLLVKRNHLDVKLTVAMLLAAIQIATVTTPTKEYESMTATVQPYRALAYIASKQPVNCISDNTLWHFSVHDKSFLQIAVSCSKSRVQE